MSDQMLECLSAVEYEKAGQKKTRWNKIGVAFPLKGGVGYTLHLDALPVNGKLVIKPPMERMDKGAADGDPGSF